MKSLTQIAAEHKCFQLQDIIKQSFNSPEHHEVLQRQVPPIPEFFRDNPDYEAGVFFRLHTAKQYSHTLHDWQEYEEIETYPDILVQDRNTGQVLDLWTDYDRKKYKFLLPLWTRRGFKMHYGKQNEITEKIPTPNRIGVFSSKKVADWFTCLAQQLKALQVAQKFIDQKNADNEAEICQFVAETSGKRTDLGTTAHVKTAFFSIEFQRDLSTGHMFVKREFTGKTSDIVYLEKLAKP